MNGSTTRVSAGLTVNPEIFARPLFSRTSKRENKGWKYCASIMILQVLKTQNLRAANVSTKKPQYKRARENLGVYSTYKFFITFLPLPFQSQLSWDWSFIPQQTILCFSALTHGNVTCTTGIWNYLYVSGGMSNLTAFHCQFFPQWVSE